MWLCRRKENGTANRHSKNLMELSVGQLLAQRASVSRREALRLISSGLVSVDGKTCLSISAKVTPESEVRLEGEVLASTPPRRQVLLYHKPVGEVCSNVSEDGRSVFDSLPVPDEGKWIMVGRLDINTSGLLLFTTDGELAYRLAHPKYKLDREYIARVRASRPGVVATSGLLAKLKRGVKLGTGDAKPAKFEDIVAMPSNSSRTRKKRAADERSRKPQGRRGQGNDRGDHNKDGASNQYFYLVVQEGRNRLVRKLWEHFGFQVSRLIRVRLGNIHLPQELKAGKHLLLNKADTKRLASCVEL